MILPLSTLAAALGLTMIGAAGCAYIADHCFTRLGRLAAGSFAVALSLAAIGILLAAIEQVAR